MESPDLVGARDTHSDEIVAMLRDELYALSRYVRNTASFLWGKLLKLLLLQHSSQVHMIYAVFSGVERRKGVLISHRYTN
jgi:hypothetical protein